MVIRERLVRAISERSTRVARADVEKSRGRAGKVIRERLLGAISQRSTRGFTLLEVMVAMAILAMAACLCLVGLPGLLTLLASLPEGGRNRPLASLASVAVLGVLLAQSGWLLRPFVVRPRAEVTFLRSVEADVFSSLASTSRSARGQYRGWEAEGGGVLGRRPSESAEVTP